MTLFIEKYKKLRQNQKIELVDIENRTKIHIKYLKALEDGNFDVIHTPYLRLFLRAYINEIGGNADEALSELTEYLLQKDFPNSKKIQNIEKIIEETSRKTSNTHDDKKIEKSSTKKEFDEELQITKNLNSDKSVTTNKKSSSSKNLISRNLIKGLLLIAFWIIAIVVIRKITITSTNEISNESVDQVIETITNFTSAEKLQTDFYEESSLQSAIDQSLPLIVKIVTNKSLGITAVQDSSEALTIPVAAGDQQTFYFEDKLDLILKHSDGISVFINGDTIQNIKSQNEPIRLIFSSDPKSITVKHYSKSG